MTQRKSSVKLIFVSIIAAVVGSLVAGQFFDSGSASIEKKLVKASNEVNQRCPILLDKETRLDTTVAGPGKKFTYFYTLIHVSSADVPDGGKEKFIDAMRPRIVNNVRTNKDLQPFRDVKVKMVYIYKTNDNKEFARIPVSPADYQ